MNDFVSKKDLQNKTNILLPTLAMFLVLSLFTTEFLSYKLISIGGYVMSAASFSIPLWYLFSDMITELYGYQMIRKLIWVSLISIFLFALLMQGLILLPSPKNWMHQPHYNHVIGRLFKITVANFIGIFLSGFLNSILLSKWKILLKGKYYWCRCLGASIVGYIVYIVVVPTILFYGLVAETHLVQIMIASLITKIIVTAIAATPISLLVRIIKNHFKMDVDDHEVSFNPFKMR